jgi:hypothetical protein
MRSRGVLLQLLICKMYLYSISKYIKEVKIDPLDGMIKHLNTGKEKAGRDRVATSRYSPCRVGCVEIWLTTSVPGASIEHRVRGTWNDQISAYQTSLGICVPVPITGWLCLIQAI